jgi:hypothetical protein
MPPAPASIFSGATTHAARFALQRPRHHTMP